MRAPRRVSVLSIRPARAVRGACCALMLTLLAACRAAPAPTEPRVEPAPLTSPAELLPDDLDFVVRIGAARIRQNPALSGIIRDLAKKQPSDLIASMPAVLGEAAAVWVGTRWMSDGFHGDGVVGIEMPPGAEVSALATNESAAWRRVAIGAGNVEAFERSASGRAEPVLRVVMNGRGVVLATVAEADAVLRVLRTRPDASRLEPPARGLLSFAGRLRGTAPFDAVIARGTFQRLTEGLVGYAGSVEEAGAQGGPVPDSIEVEGALTYASTGDATRAAERARETVERLASAGSALGSMAHSTKLTEVGSSLQVRVKVPFAWLAELH